MCEFEGLGKQRSIALLTDEIALSISMFKATKTGYSRQILLKFIRCCDSVDIPWVMDAVVTTYRVAVH